MNVDLYILDLNNKQIINLMEEEFIIFIENNIDNFISPSSFMNRLFNQFTNIPCTTIVAGVRMYLNVRSLTVELDMVDRWFEANEDYLRRIDRDSVMMHEVDNNMNETGTTLSLNMFNETVEVDYNNINNPTIIQNSLPINKFLTEEQFIKLYDNPIKHSDNICCICNEDIIYENADVITLQCGHTFHDLCLHTWAKKSIICPTCRKDIL